MNPSEIAVALYMLLGIIPGCYIVWRLERDTEYYWKRYEKD